MLFIPKYDIIHLKVGDDMKKLFVLVLVVFVVLISGCSAPTDKVLESLGEYKSEQYFTSGGFQAAFGSLSPLG